MTTKLDSFDAAVLDSFIDSGLDARNLPQPRAGAHVIIVWGDHAIPVPFNLWLSKFSANWFDAEAPVFALREAWNDVSDGTSVVDPDAAYGDAQLANLDKSRFRGRLNTLGTQGYDVDDIFTFAMIQGVRPNTFGGRPRAFSDTAEPSFDTMSYATNVNTLSFVGTTLMGGVVPPIQYSTWKEDVDTFDWPEFWSGIASDSPGAPREAKGAFVADNLGALPNGGPNAATGNTTVNRRRILDVFDAFWDAAPRGNVVDITNIFLSAVGTSPQSWLFADVLMVHERNKTGLSVTAFPVAANNRWYLSLNQIIDRVTATLPPP